MKIPRERFAEDVMGMPVFATEEKFLLHVQSAHMKDHIPLDDENCAVAKGCKGQLNTPYVSVGRSRTDIALPHPDGVEKPGFGTTKWAVHRFKNSVATLSIIVAADTGELMNGSAEGVMVSFLPTAKTNRPAVRKAANGGRKRTVKKKKKDPLTEKGVRILTGQRKR